MDFYDDNASDSTGTDLLASSSPSTAGSSQRPNVHVGLEVASELTMPGLQHEQEEHATRSFASYGTNDGRRTPAGPPSARLFDKLGQLEKRWTDKASPKQSRTPPRSTPRPFESPHAMASVQDSVSPITLTGESPIIASADVDASVSTYGSLGSPGSFFVEASPQPQQPKKPSATDSIFDRLHRGEKRTYTLRSPIAKSKSTPKSPPPRTTAGTSRRAARMATPAPTSTNNPSFFKSLTKRKNKFAPAVPRTPLAAPRTPGSLASTPSTPCKTSVFERLYKKEKREKSLWTDPGARRGRHYQYVKSGGKTNMIESSTSVKGFQRKLKFPDYAISSYNGAVIGKLSTSIQTGWRFHQAQRLLIGNLVECYSVNCWPADHETAPDNRILLIKFGMLARISAIQQADLTHLGQRTIKGPENTMLLDSVTDVCFEAWDSNDVVVQRRYTVSVHCQIKTIQLLQCWSPEKLGYTLHRWALEESYHEQTDTLSYESASKLQQWLLAVRFQNCKHAAESPTSSVASEISLHRQIEKYESLSWFHDRLRKEALSAKLARFQVAALVIQNAVRRSLAQRQAQVLREAQDSQLAEEAMSVGFAAVVIQAATRRYRAQKHAEALRESQAWQQSEAELRVEMAAVIIQAATRRYQTQKQAHYLQLATEARRYEMAAVIIQIAAKRYLARQILLKTRWAVIKIQSAWRAALATAMAASLHSVSQTLRQKEHKTGATISIQSAFRKNRAMASYQQLKRNATLIQAFQRRHRALASYHRLRQETIKIQSFQRMRIERAQLNRRIAQRRESAVVIMQRWISRRYTMRQMVAAESQREYVRREISAVIIKKAYRVFKYRQALMAASSLQRCWRSYKPRTSYLKLLSSSRRIQKFTRDVVLVKRPSAILIQNNYRAVRDRASYLMIKKAVLRIQYFWQRHKPQDSDQRQLHLALVKIQTKWRTQQSTQTRAGSILAATTAVLIIQSSYRAFRPRQSFLTLRKASLKIQALGRSFIIRREVGLMKYVAVKIQRWIRGFGARHHIASEQAALARKRMSATKIQSLYRAHPQKQAFCFLRCAAILVQAFVRGSLTRNEASRQMRAVLFLQRAWRRHQERCSYLQKQKARLALILTSIGRGYLARKHQAEAIRAATLIQRRCRSFLCRVAPGVIRNSIIIVQTGTRGWLCRNPYLTRRLCAISIQAVIRGRMQRHTCTKIRGGINLIQAVCRRRICRRKYLLLLKSVAMVKTTWRDFRKRQHLMRLLMVTRIQTYWKASFQRRNFLRLRRATIALQSLVRKYLVRQMMLWWQAAAKRIQSEYSKRKCYLPQYRRRTSAIIVQRNVRALICRRNFFTLSLARSLLPKQTQQKFVSSKVSGRVLGGRVRALLRDRLEMAVLMQTWLRKERAMSTYKQVRGSVAALQLWARRKVLPQVRLRASASTLIQSFWRQKVAQENFLMLLTSGRFLSQQTREKMASRLQGPLWGRRVHHLLLARAKFALRIQNAWRAHKAQSIMSEKKQALILFQLQEACTKAQAWWRMHKCRRDFQKTHHALLVVQAVCKRNIEQSKRNASAIQIENVFRMTRQRRHYQIQRGSAIRIQRQLQTGMLQELMQQKRSASTIATWWRMSIAQRNYCRLLACETMLSRSTVRSMTRKIQKNAWGLGLQVRRQIQVRAESAVVIQSAWRGWMARDCISTLHHAAIMVQKTARMHVVFCRMRISKLAAVLLQKRIRGLLVLCQMRKLQLAAVEIQSAWRTLRCSRRHRTWRFAVLAIQSTFRVQSQRREFIQLKAAACLLQRAWNRHLDRLECTRRTEAVAAGKLQAIVRRWIAQSQFRVAKHSAVVVQKQWRVHSSMCAFARQQNASVVLQRFTRGSVLGRAMQRDAAVRVQAAWRASACSRHCLCLRHSAMTIQSAFRMHLDEKKLHQCNISALALQRTWKRHACALRSEQNTAALKIQVVARSWSVQRKARSSNCAAVLLQKQWRAHVLQCVFAKQRSASVAMQDFVRTAILGRTRRRDAAVKIQTVWRISAGARHYLCLRHSALTIQSTFRMHLKEKKLRQSNMSALAFQRAWKRHTHRRKNKQRVAATKIQALARSWFVLCEVKNSHHAANLVQKQWRAHLSQSAHARKQKASSVMQCFTKNAVLGRALKRDSAVRLQTAWRAFRCIRHWTHVKIAVISIQSNFRRHSQKQKMMQLRALATSSQRAWRGYRMDQAAIKIQSHFRGWNLRQCLIQMAVKDSLLASSALTLQKAWRNYLSKSKLHRLQVTEAIKIQAMVRTWIAKNKLASYLHAAVQIQNQWRAHTLQFFPPRRQKASRTIQGFIRGSVLGKSLKQDAAITIQAAWKGSQCRRHYAFSTIAAITIQSSVRMHLHMNKFVELRTAASRLQKVWRRFTVDRAQHLAASMIQAHIRGWLFREQLIQLAVLNAALIIQKSWKRFFLFQKLAHGSRRRALKFVAASAIQSVWRMKLQSASHKQTRKGVATIQCWWRSHSPAVAFKRQHSACTKIQSLVRQQAAAAFTSDLKAAREAQLADWAAIVIQSRWRCFSAAISFKKQQSACIKIQSKARWHSAATLTQSLKAAVEAQLSHAAANVLQSWWRSVSAAITFKRQRSACIKIQSQARRQCVSSLIRASKAAKEAQLSDAAATVIQSRWRSSVTTNVFRRQHSSCVTIQTFAKRFLSEKVAGQQMRSAIQLQTRWRRVKFDAETEAVVLLQATWRRANCQSKCKASRVFACLIQSVFRRHLDYNRFHLMRSAACKMQSCFRMHQQRERFFCLAEMRGTSAALTLQRAWRGSTLQNFARKAIARRTEAQRLRRSGAAVRIQTAWRRVICPDLHEHKAQERIVNNARQEACVVIQAFVRQWLNEKLFQVKIASAVLIQSHFRMHLSHTQYLMLRVTATLIQSVCRSYTKRAVHARMMVSATALQSLVRMHLAHKKFEQNRSAIATLQSFGRVILAMKTSFGLRTTEAEERHRDDSAGRLQALVRGRKVRKTLCQQANAAIVIQSWSRKMLDQNQCNQQRAAASTIASAQSSASRRNEHLNHATRVGIIQKWHRRHAMAHRTRSRLELAQIANEAALEMQKFWLRQIQSKQAAARHQAAKRIQDLYRHGKRRESAADCIQSLWRCHAIYSRLGGQQLHVVNSLVDSLKETVREDLHCCLKDSAMLGVGVPLETTEQNEVNHSAVKLQRWTRRILAEQMLQTHDNAARIIQTRFIDWKANLSLMAVQSSVVLMKRSHNGLLPSSAMSFAMQQLNRELGTVFLKRRQWLSDVRWISATAACEHYASIKLQQAMQKQLVKKRALKHWNGLPSYVQMSRAAIVSLDIDDKLVSWMLMFHGKQHMEEHRKAAIRIQRCFRRTKCSPWDRVVLGIVHLQSLVRVKLAKQLKRRRCAAIAALQVNLPVLVVQCRVHRTRQGAVKVQSLVRAWLVWRAHLQQRQVWHAAVRLQSFVRTWLGKKAHLQQRMVLAAKRGTMLRSELQRFLLDRVYVKTQRAAKIEVDSLLSQNGSAGSSGVCLRRLAERVVLGRLQTEEERNQRATAVDLLELERKCLRDLSRTLFWPAGGQEN